jgi:hypothetical protein
MPTGGAAERRRIAAALRDAGEGADTARLTRLGLKELAR